MDALDIALGEFGQLLGIDGLVFDDDECQIEIGGIALDLLADRSQQRLGLSALAAELPNEGRGELLARLLDANCDPAMGGAALGVPAGSGAAIVVDQIAAAGISGRTIETAVESFLAALDYARRLVEGVARRGGEAARVGDAADSVMLRL